MKKLYKEQKHTIYEIQKHLGFSKVTIYNYVKGKNSIDSMKIGDLVKIAKYEEMEPMELYEKIKQEEENR